MNEIVLSQSGFFSIHAQSVLSTSQKAVKLPSAQPDIRSATSEKIANWGDDNMYPTFVLEQIEKVTLVHPILEWQARAIYGGGIVYGLLEVDENGMEKWRQIVDPEIEDFLESSDLMAYVMEASMNFYTFRNIFPELTQSLDGSRINFLTVKDSVDCRWAKRSTDGRFKGHVETCYMSPDWIEANENSKEILEFPVVPKWNPIEFMKAQKNKAFIYPISFPSLGRPYYQRAPWHVLLDTWLPIAKEIPRFKRALLENQLSVKYIIRVPEWWWSWKYKDWDKKSEPERIEVIKKEHSDFDKFFSGTGQGKSFMYTQRDSTPAKQYASWEIEVVDDKLKNGMYIEDSQEADAHIFKNLVVDPTLFGSGPGKNNKSSGSGSDKRVAWNNYVIQQQPYQDLILKPLSIVATYNGWRKRIEKPGQRLQFWFRSYQIARLDTGQETQTL